MKIDCNTSLEKDHTVTNACMVNCGSRCALRVHVEGERVVRIETDNSGEDIYGAHQVRACLRGRSMRKRIESKDRLKFPLKRVGPRGSGEFERVSWDEALDDIAVRMQSVKEQYGPEAFYMNYATGTVGSVMSKSWPPTASPLGRLMNCFGGYLNPYSTYSFAQIHAGLGATYGDAWRSGNSMSDVINSKLVVLFGNNVAETRMSGGGMIHDLLTASHKVKPRVIVIDPRYSDTASIVADQWIPIRPGTDAALVNAIAYVLITENLVDQPFLDRYCVGYDESSLPPGESLEHSYKSYILGQSRDKIAKTPVWASKITGIPVDIITDLAIEIGRSKPAYICQGWGPQRHYNGENAARSIGMLPILTGNIGIQGGNPGTREGGVGLPWPAFPTLENPVKAAIPVFMWSDAVSRGSQLTALKDGVRGTDQLSVPIKFLWNYAGNCLINQHSEINKTKTILGNENLCETIVVIDHFMTSSAEFADYVLPGVSNLEEDDFAVQPAPASSEMGYVIFCKQAIPPMFESRTIYDICADLAERLNIADEFTEGRTRDQWLEFLYQRAKQDYPDLPESLEDAWNLGIYKRTQSDGPVIALKEFRENPEINPLNTPSGKIEIFSSSLSKLSETWELPEGDFITALPEYQPEKEGAFDQLRSKYPLQMITHHYKQRTHSTYGNVDWLEKVAPQCLWINPLDAAPRNIKHGDDVGVYNGRGRCVVKAKVTTRIAPGVVSLPQGAWYRPDANGIDYGGSANTLTFQKPTALAKGNPQNSTLVEVQRHE